MCKRALDCQAMACSIQQLPCQSADKRENCYHYAYALPAARAGSRTSPVCVSEQAWRLRLAGKARSERIEAVPDVHRAGDVRTFADTAA